MNKRWLVSYHSVGIIILVLSLRLICVINAPLSVDGLLRLSMYEPIHPIHSYASGLIESQFR